MMMDMFSGNAITAAGETSNPKYPKSHRCEDAWRGRLRSGRGNGRGFQRGKRGGRRGNRRGRGNSGGVNSQRPSTEHEEELEHESSESEHNEVPSPFNVEPESYTPGDPLPHHNVADLDPRKLLKQQVQMQKKLYDQQEDFKKFLENQQNQFLQTLEKQQHNFVEKDNVVKDLLEESKRKEDNTNALLEMMKTQSLNSRRNPCPKWTKDELSKPSLPV